MAHSSFLGRDMEFRENGADHHTWESVFTKQYHVPPASWQLPHTVLDLGSNVGYTVAYYKKLWPWAHVVGVELDESNLEIARRNNPDCEILHYAVTDEDAVASYDPTQYPTSFSLEREGHPSSSVPSRRLGTLIREYFGGAVDFVKMDIEGSEWKVLKDREWGPMVKAMHVELHGDNPFFEKVYGENTPENLVKQGTLLLEGLGFTVSPHEEHLQSVWAWS